MGKQKDMINEDTGYKRTLKIKQVLAERHSFPSLGGRVGSTLRLMGGEIGQRKNPLISSRT